MENKVAYETKLQAQLKKWSAKIAEFRALAEQAEADAQMEYYKQVDELRLRQLKVEERLKDLRRSSEDGWDDLKGGVEDAINDLESAIRKASARFR